MLRREDRLIWGLAATQVASWGVLYYAFSVLLVPMQRDLGWSRSVLVGGFTVAIVTSGVLAPLVGQALDTGSPRRIMTAGSAAAGALVLAWAAVESVALYYLVWLGIGVTMALVLYEPAFTVLAKAYAPHHQRALTAVMMVAGLTGFGFQPLTSALATGNGWRTTLVVLAVGLWAVTVPLHLWVLPRADPSVPRRRTDPWAWAQNPPEAGDGRFWPVVLAFAGAVVTSFATSVLLVAYLVDHDWSLGRAALAGGTLAAMQLPGRMIFGPLHRRLSPAALAATILSLPGFGVLSLLAAGDGGFVWGAVVVLGIGQGANTLLRANLVVDLYGPARIGVLMGVSAMPATLARALAPLGFAALVSATGDYTSGFVILVGIAGLSALVAFRALLGVPSVHQPFACDDGQPAPRSRGVIPVDHPMEH